MPHPAGPAAAALHAAQCALVCDDRRQQNMASVCDSKQEITSLLHLSDTLIVVILVDWYNFPSWVHDSGRNFALGLGEPDMVNGTVIPVGSFGCLTVDYWKRSVTNVLWAFLTHAHADHLHGLSETWTGTRQVQGELQSTTM